MQKRGGSMIEYQITKEPCYYIDLGYYTAYGITAFSFCGGKKVPVVHISDVCLNRKKASALVRLCNENHVAPIHLTEIV